MARTADARRRRRAAAIALLLVALASAAPAARARQAGQEEGAVLQWYQLYERGLELAGRGDWRAALDDFAAAARVRRQPADRVRTYGTRFLADYDPAFQQARCLVALGRLAEAEPLLAEAEAAGVTGAAEIAALRERLEAREREASRAAEAPAQVRSPPEPVPERDEPAASAGAAPVPAPPPGRAGAERDREAPGADATAPEASLPAVPPGAARLDPAPEATPREVPAEAPDEVQQAQAGAEPGEGSRDPVRDPIETPPDDPADLLADGASDAGREAVPRDAGLPPAWRSALVLLAALALLAAVAAVVLRLLRRDARRSSANHRASTLPRRIGGYRVSGELGRGGMATTYRAERLRDGLPVAVKVPHETGDPTYLERFLREGRLGETLHHPRIVRIVEAGEDGGRPFLALELIPGTTLREAIDAADGPYPTERALTIARDIAEALDYAHGKGVVHRDLKPENVMLLPDGTVKVMDFGVARVEGQPGLTTSRFFFGSPVYAAPELVDPLSIDHRADLYSLGVILFELLEGRPPFHHESVFKLLEMHQREPLPDPAGLDHPPPPEVWAVVARLLAKEPARRYASAQELLADLRTLLYEPSGARVGSVHPR